jgi:hypothetical protein
MANTALEARTRYVTAQVHASLERSRAGWEIVDPSPEPDSNTVVAPDARFTPSLRSTIAPLVADIFIESRFALRQRARDLRTVVGNSIPLLNSTRSLRAGVAYGSCEVVLERNLGRGELFDKAQALTHELVRDLQGI